MSARRSVYRNIFLVPSKESYNVVPLSKDLELGRQISISTDHLIVAADPKGSVAGIFHSDIGLKEPRATRTMLMKGAVTDIEHSPFYPSASACSGDDGMIKVSECSTGPDGSLSFKTIFASTALDKRIANISWNPVADLLLAGSCMDGSVKLWDLQFSQEVRHSAECPIPYMCEWGASGNTLAVSTREKGLSVIDPRGRKSSIGCANVFSSNKPTRLTWLDENTIVAAGFDGMGTKKVKVFDQRSFTGPVSEQKLGGSSGSPQLYFDPSARLLFLSGRGESVCQVMDWEGGKLGTINDQKFAKQASGMGFLPKRCIDISRNEIARVYRTEVDLKRITVGSFVVQRKDEGYSPELFGDISAPEPRQTSEQWFASEALLPQNFISFNDLASGACELTELPLPVPQYFPSPARPETDELLGDEEDENWVEENEEQGVEMEEDVEDENET